MEIKMKETNGITLIALVITIIVLLILAGVAIATLTGDNGILTQSQKAKFVNIYKGAEEQVNLATMAVKAEIAGQKAKSGTYNATDTESINALKAIVASDLVSTGSGFEVADPEETTAGTKQIKIRYSNTALKASGISDGVPAQTGHVNYVITVTAGDATLESDIADGDFEPFTAGTGNSGNGGNTSASPTAEFGNANQDYKDYFGKVVTGYNGYTSYANTDVWRLFYADDNYAYLIKDSIGNQSLSSINGFSGITEVSDFTKNFNPQYHNWTLQTNSSLNNNLKAVEALMTPGNWTNYKVDGVAEWAVGAPTLEMFVASYNATHTSAMHTADSNVIAQQIACTVESGDTVTGYKVKKGEEAYDTYTTGLGNTSDLDKAIYCQNSGYWWLASPSAAGSDRMMSLGSRISGTLDNSNYSNGAGVRPLVSVPKSKIGLASENKTLTITNDYFMSTAN